MPASGTTEHGSRVQAVETAGRRRRGQRRSLDLLVAALVALVFLAGVVAAVTVRTGPGPARAGTADPAATAGAADVPVTSTVGPDPPTTAAAPPDRPTTPGAAGGSPSTPSSLLPPAAPPDLPRVLSLPPGLPAPPCPFSPSTEGRCFPLLVGGG
jgi:hypothetical protein